MELSHLNQNLYQRAITASVEGQLNQDGKGRGLTPEAATSVKKEAPAAIQRHRNQQQRLDDVQRRVQSEQQAQRYIAGHEHDSTSYAEAANLGDQLAVASRQARQSRARRSYTPAALVSATGQEANRRYLDVLSTAQPRFVDEIV